MKRKFLFIGGKLDGHWGPVNTDLFGIPKSLQTISVASKQPSVVQRDGTIPKSMEYAQTVIYRREELRSKNKTWYFYIPVDMPVAEGLDRLIKGYKGKEGKKK